MAVRAPDTRTRSRPLSKQVAVMGRGQRAQARSQRPARAASHSLRERLLRFRFGQQAHAGGEDHAEGSEGTGNEARDVVTRHVLDDGAAEHQTLAQAVDDLNAEHRIAHATPPGTCRSGQARGDGAAERALAAELGWIEGEHLTVRVEEPFNVRERCASARGEHQLVGAVGYDTGVTGDGQRRFRLRLAEEPLAAVAADGEGVTVCARGRDGGDYRFGVVPVFAA